jgi:hypothetical protein
MLDDVVRQRLCQCVDLLEEAKRGCSDPSAFARMKVMLLLDRSVELALQTLFPSCGAQASLRGGFSGMLSGLCDGRPRLRPHSGRVRELRRLSNRMHSRGIVPSPAYVQRAVVDVELFMTEAVDEVLSVDLRSIWAGPDTSRAP